MWYKAHRYLSNIHSNLLFYLQTETYVSRPLQTPPLPVSPYYHTDLLLQHFSHTILAFSLSLFPPFPSVFIRLYHLLPSVSQTLPPDLPVNAPTFTLSHCSPPSALTLVFLCAMQPVPLGPLRARIWNILERHIFAVLEHKGICHGRGPFEVASQGEPEPERGIWETIKKR